MAGTILSDVKKDAQILANNSGKCHVVYHLNGDHEFPFYVARADFVGSDLRSDLVARVSPINHFPITSDYVVLNDLTLGYFDKDDKKRIFMEVLAGYYDWRNGSVCVSALDAIRVATLADFDRFRVMPPRGLFQ